MCVCVYRYVRILQTRGKEGFKIQLESCSYVGPVPYNFRDLGVIGQLYTFPTYIVASKSHEFYNCHQYIVSLKSTLLEADFSRNPHIRPLQIAYSFINVTRQAKRRLRIIFHNKLLLHRNDMWV